MLLKKEGDLKDGNTTHWYLKGINLFNEKKIVPQETMTLFYQPMKIRPILTAMLLLKTESLHLAHRIVGQMRYGLLQKGRVILNSYLI